LSSRNRLVVNICLLAFMIGAAAACSSEPAPLVVPTVPPLPPTSTTPVVPVTPSPTPTPTVSQTPTPTLTTTPEKPIYQAGHAYRAANGPNEFIFGESIGEVSNFQLDTDVVFQTAAGDCSYLVLFRAQDSNNCYYFEVLWVNNQYGLGKRVNGKWSYLDSGVSSVLKRLERNHIRIVCQGSLLQVYGNGVKIAEATDSTFTAGKVYLVARSSGSPKTVIDFSDVNLTATNK
jgi:hypothetical protein